MIDTVKPCPCGSGRPSTWQYDGNNIPLCRTCRVCHETKMAQYRPVIFTNYTQNDVDEPIEES